MSKMIAKQDATIVSNASCETDLNSENRRGTRQTMTIDVVLRIVLAVFSCMLIMISDLFNP